MELYTWKLYYFTNQYHPDTFNKHFCKGGFGGLSGQNWENTQITKKDGKHSDFWSILLVLLSQRQPLDYCSRLADPRSRLQVPPLTIPMAAALSRVQRQDKIFVHIDIKYNWEGRDSCWPCFFSFGETLKVLLIFKSPLLSHTNESANSLHSLRHCQRKCHIQ